jgi:predicted dienelactone hydrolase
LTNNLPNPQPTTPYKVGLRTLNLHDESRANWTKTGPRPLITGIWYPAQAVSIETDTLIGPPDAPLFTAGRAAINAEIAQTSTKLPLILLSHGTGGTVTQLGWLACALAQQGYITAGVNHHGNNALEPYTPEGFIHFWERAVDLTFLLTNLLADPYFGNTIDPDRVGAAGFSLGGYTVIALAGGRFDLSAYKAFCDGPEREATCDPPPEFPGLQTFLGEAVANPTIIELSSQSYKDERIKAALSIAPVLASGATPASLSSIIIPIRIIVGSADELAPLKTNAFKFATGISGAQLTLLPKPVAHYTFLAEATDLGKEILPEFCQDHPSINRRQIHSTVSRMAIDFFQRI